MTTFTSDRRKTDIKRLRGHLFKKLSTGRVDSGHLNRRFEFPLQLAGLKPGRIHSRLGVTRIGAQQTASIDVRILQNRISRVLLALA